MSGYIRMDKDLADDPRVLALADAWLSYVLSCAPDGELPVTVRDALRLMSRHAANGSLFALWAYADTHIRAGNTLAIALHNLADVTRLPVTVFDRLPPEWFEQLPDGRVSLPDYADKNALNEREKRRAQQRKRVKRWREKRNASGNALQSVTSTALHGQQNDRSNATSRARARARVPEPVPTTEPVPTHTLTRARAPENPDRALTEETLDAWRRDIPECDPSAYETWLAWRASQSDPVPPAVRIAEAKFLAGKGSAERQRAFVSEIVRLQFKRMHDPLGRAVANGASTNLRKTYDDAEREASERLEQAPGEDPGAY